jgi:hypothetical protein
VTAMRRRSWRRFTRFWFLPSRSWNDQ